MLKTQIPTKSLGRWQMTESGTSINVLDICFLDNAVTEINLFWKVFLYILKDIEISMKTFFTSEFGCCPLVGWILIER